VRANLGICAAVAIGMGAVIAFGPSPAPAYIGGPPATLGMMCNWSTHVITVRVERLDREKGVLIFRRLTDIKGKWPTDVIRQVIPPGYPDRARIFEWAEVGKTTVMFALESYRWSHTYIDSLWYASNTADWQWWNVSHSEPIVLRTYTGKTERLVAACSAILTNKEVVVPCMTDGTPEELQQRKTKVQRMRASLKLLDYNPKRDFAGWGGDDFTAMSGMPGFTHICGLARVDPEAQAVSCVDFNDDGRLDLCLAGAGRLTLMQNSGDYWSETAIPGATGCRAAVWADFNGDGLPDLLLATPTGPKLFANQGNGVFKDVSNLLPHDPACHLTAAAWIDYDGDGRPDILLATGFHGLRLLRNKGKAPPANVRVRPGQTLPPPEDLGFEDVSDKVGLGADGIGAHLRGDSLTVCDVNGDGRPDFLYGAGSGILVLNTPGGFVEANDSGISFKPGKVGAVFGDFDGDGHPDLFVPQSDGRCKLFRNDGKGRFTDVTAKAGDLNRTVGMATSAAWGDFFNHGKPDLVVGCLRGPNRLFRNKGDGTFEDVTEEVGLHQRIFNTVAVAMVDVNNDGMLDLVLVNEGQESVVLLGNKAKASGRTALTVPVVGPLGVVGSEVTLRDAAGKFQARTFLSGGDGRGSQAAPVARFAVPPGAYRIETRFSSGLVQVKEVAVGATHRRVVIDDEMPAVK
jgi:hypothetical protein